MSAISNPTSQKKSTFRLGRFCLHLAILAGLFFLTELLIYLLVMPETVWPLLFGFVWAVLLGCICLLLPRLAGKIVFGICYFIPLLWGLSQVGYYFVFDKMMWLSTIRYAGEGMVYIADIIISYPPLWWIGGIGLLTAGVFVIVKFPHQEKTLWHWLIHGLLAASMISALFIMPEIMFLRDNSVWGTRSEYGQSSSYRAAYNTMYDAKRVYDICGIRQMMARDILVNVCYPLTPSYQIAQKNQVKALNNYFADRQTNTENEMTGIYEGKNVIMVLMESMDDWLITQEDTPTIARLMDEGINFTQFYTPGYGSARTLNSEFCMNTGIYLPTTGHYVFDYVTNHFHQSLPNQAKSAGYSAEVFHYNDPDFYSRGVFEPVMGYNSYVCYEDYTEEEQELMDDCILFDIPEVMDIFFREGPTFNTIITRSAHLSYVYNEVLSAHALRQYPDYRGMYGSEEEDCARVKAKLVDDMFSRLLQELENRGELDNTVIIGITDHYTYGYKDEEELFAHSDVDHALQLEKTPCFVWTPGGVSMEVDKTLNTSDFVPTILNLLGIDSPYHYLGQDAFDSNYSGYALFPDGSWVQNGVFCDEEGNVIANENNIPVTQDYIEKMQTLSQSYIEASNLLLTCDYYKRIR